MAVTPRFARWVGWICGWGGAALAAFLESMETFCNERRQIVRQAKLQRLLHSWLLIHVPLSVMLLLLGIAHVISALYW